MKKSKKAIIIILSIVLLACIAYPIEHFYGDNIYGAFAFSKSKVVQIDDDTYRCSKDNYEDFLKVMEKDGWKFSDQMGSAYMYKKGDKSAQFILEFKEFYSGWKAYMD